MKTKLRCATVSLLIVSTTGCAALHKPTRDDRLSLASRARIYAVHHSPATVFMVRQHTSVSLLLGTPAVLETVSEGRRLQSEHRVEDPAPRVKARWVSALQANRVLQANLNMANVNAVSDPPQNDEVKTLRSLFRTGVVFDVRTMKWGLGTADALAIYSARARMISLEDSTVLWEATCSARSDDALDPLGARLLRAADECAAQLSARALGQDPKRVLAKGHTIPAEGLPSMPRVVVDVHPIEPARFEIGVVSSVEHAEASRERMIPVRARSSP